MFKRNRSSVITSRLKAFQTFADSFSLTSGLKNGWKTYRGTWSSTGTLANSSDTAQTYTLAGTKMASTNVIASANVTGGTGVAFWITDAQSWYATVAYNNTTTSYPCNASYVTSGSNPASGSCCSSTSLVSATQPAYSYSVAASYQNAYSYTYGASYQQAYSYSYSAQYNAPYSYSYSAQYNNSYSYVYSAVYHPSTSYSYNYSATLVVSGGGPTSIGCYRAFSGCPTTYNGYAVTETSAPGLCGCSTGNNLHCCYYNAPGTSSYTCPSGGTLSGNICYGATGQTGAYYGCDSGGTLFAGTLCQVNVGASYSCPSGGSLSGTTCTVSVGSSYSCPSGGYVSGTSCIVNVGAYYYCSGSDSISGTTCTRQVPGYYYCNSGTLNGSNCTIQVAAVPAVYGCYTATTPTPVNNYYLRVIKSSGGAISTVGSDVALSTAPFAIRIASSGNSVASTAYSDSALLTQLGTRTDSFTSPNKTGITGIIKSPADYIQGSTVSNFSATI